MIRINFGMNHKTYPFGFRCICRHLFFTLDVTEFTRSLILLLEFGLINYRVRWVINDLSIVMFIKVRKYVEYLLKMAFTR